jgi:hypothetical protein
MIDAHRKMDAALLLGILLAIILYFLIPATCPGFPRPLVKQIYYSNQTTTDGDRIFHIDGRVTNEGTRGNVVITTALVNVTNTTQIVNSTTIVFMQQGQEISVKTTLTGRTSEPCEIRITARRR